MRITNETLEKVTRDTVKLRAKKNRSILAAYLQGSFVSGNPLLGGAADIDLVFIHIAPPEVRREILPLTDDVHLDIEHHGQSEYENPRELRVDPWTGPRIYHARILYDPRHIMDFAQASVRGLYHRSDFTHQRSQAFFQLARKGWLDLQLSQGDINQSQLTAYLDALMDAGNAAAVIHGKPLTRRRFLLDFPARAELAGSPGLYHGLIGLLGAPNVDANTLRSWVVDWQQAVLSVPEADLPLELNPDRQVYYRKAFDVILDSGNPKDVLLPLLYTWTLAAANIEPDNLAAAGWRAVCEQLGLAGDGFDERLQAFDAYLDVVEDTIDAWASDQGV